MAVQPATHYFFGEDVMAFSTAGSLDENKMKKTQGHWVDQVWGDENERR
jgi:hypothetical protein